jgi:hypothetical protein
MKLYSIRIRVEIDPASSSETNLLNDPDARKAIIQALAKLMTMGSIPAGHLEESSHGLSTASVMLTGFGEKRDPAAKDTFVPFEVYKFGVGLEQSEPGSN